ncbi:MAG: hypothetical protein AABZ80_13245 [Gemmatimonadota bacterium]
MTSPFSFFRNSNLWTDCEACREKVNLSQAGACSQCRRVLCNRHLHGSFVRRLLYDIGLTEAVCAECRAK